MAPRAYWTGNLRVSLVTVPVRLYPAIDRTHQVTLHQIHEPTGERIRYQKVAGTGLQDVPVSDEEIVKGYEYEHGRYVTLTDEELDRLKLDTVHTIDIVEFVDGAEIDPIYHYRPYYVAPDGAAADEAFRVIRDALLRTQKVGLGQVVLGGRERIVALRPCGRGLLLEALRYEDELRESNVYFRNIPDEPAEPDQLELAVQLIESRTTHFDPGVFRDRYQEALRDLVAAKLDDREAEALEEESVGAAVIDLTDALRRSLSQSRRGQGGRPAPRAQPRGRTGGRTASSRKRA